MAASRMLSENRDNARMLHQMIRVSKANTPATKQQAFLGAATK
jgi:hypothetical protein